GQALLAASIAGLPGSNACVIVKPPLFCNGPSNGLVVCKSPGLMKPQLVPLSRLCPTDMTMPVQLGAPELPATILSRTVMRSGLLGAPIPAPELLLFAVIVTLARSIVPRS